MLIFYTVQWGIVLLMVNMERYWLFRKGVVACTGVLIYCVSTYVMAVAYVYPGGPVVPVAPLTLSAGDSLAVNSGSFTSDAIPYTVGKLSGGASLITIDTGATVSNSSTGAAFSLNGATNITNQGTISSTNGVAINLNTGAHLDALNRGVIGTTSGVAISDQTAVAGSCIIRMRGVNAAIIGNVLSQKGADVYFGDAAGLEKVDLSTQGSISANQIQVLKDSIVRINHTISFPSAGSTFEMNSATVFLNQAFGTIVTDNNTFRFGVGVPTSSFNIAADFTPSKFSFIFNEGTFYLIGAGSIVGSLTNYAGGFASLIIGRDSNSLANVCDYTTSGSIKVKNLTVAADSALTANNPIELFPGVQFTIEAGAKATINSGFSGGDALSTLTNIGTLTLNYPASFSLVVDDFVNSGNLNIGIAFNTAAYAFNNTGGNIFVYGVYSTLSGPLVVGNSLNFGKDSFGTMNIGSWTINSAISDVTTLNLFGGSLSNSAAITGITDFNITGTCNMNAVVEATNVNIESGSVVTLNSDLTTTTLDNAGQMTMADSSSWTLSGVATNHAGCKLIVNGGTDPTIIQGGAGSIINDGEIDFITNSGSIGVEVPVTNQTGGKIILSGPETNGVTATGNWINQSGAIINTSVPFDVSGTLQNFGIINFGADATSAGAITNSNGAAIYIFTIGSSLTFNNPITGVGYNSVIIGSDSSGNDYDATYVLDEIDAVTNLFCDTGDVTFAGAVNNVSTFTIDSDATATLSAGGIIDDIVVENGGVMTIDNSEVTVNNALSINGDLVVSGGTAILYTDVAVDFAVNATGTVTVGNGATVDLIGGTVDNSGTITMTGAIVEGTINNSGLLTSAGTSALTSLTINNNADGIFNVIASRMYSGGVVNNSGQMTLAANFSGTAPINNLSGGTIDVNTGTTSIAGVAAFDNANGGTINFTTNITNARALTNAGIINISAPLTQNNSLINNSPGQIVLANNTVLTGSSTITNATGATISVTGANVTNTLNFTGDTNDGTLTIASGAQFVDNSANALDNNGTINVVGLYHKSEAITNYAIMNISGALDGPLSALTNESGATLNFDGGNTVLTAANNSKPLTLNAGGTLNISGYLNHAPAITNPVGGIVNLNGANITAVSALNNAGTLNVNSASTISGSYTNTGTHNIVITDGSNFGQLLSASAIDLSGSTVNLDTSFVGSPNVIYTWVLVGTSLPGGLTASPEPTVTNLPQSTFYRFFNVMFTDTQMIATSLYRVPTAGINQEIANIINNMYNNPANPEQQALVNAFLNYSTEFNEDLHEMLPVSNPSRVGMFVQSTVFNKTEARLAMLRDTAHSKRHGYVAGDLVTGDSFWLAGYGVLTNQHPDETNDGYNAKTGVILGGFDKKICDNVVGVGIGYAYTRTQEFISSGFITGTNSSYALLYGTHYYKYCNYIDWLVSASYNRNHSNRDINVGGVNLSTFANYDDYAAAVKLVRGTEFDFWSSYRLTPFTSVQYTYIHQDGYNEQGSVAVLHVAERSKSVVTLGAGVRFNFPLDAWRAVGMRELRAGVTYDVLNSSDITTANFIAGSSTFNIVDAPSRLGMQLGAGITLCLSENVQFLVNYDFQWRSGFTEHVGLLKLRLML